MQGRRRRLRPVVPEQELGESLQGWEYHARMGHPGLPNCTEKFIEQRLDHFGWEQPSSRVEGANDTYLQRYFLCDLYFKPSQDPPVIFFYTGNEGDVELYLNETGLMWETGAEMGALLVFAEHRYFGKSLPFATVKKSVESPAARSFLSAEQALADYAYLLRYLKSELNVEEAAVVSFGGSYGGMLSTWFRLKYPYMVDGAIAGSAPIWSYEGENPPVNPLYYADTETFDASPEGGATAGCADNYRRSWQELFKLGETASGRQQIEGSLRLCPSSPVSSPAAVADLVNWIANAVSFLSMGSYPYPSAYMLNGLGVLPPYPLRLGCKSLGPIPSTAPVEQLLDGLREAVGVWYNFSGTVGCFDWSAAPNNATQLDGDLWNIMACVEEAMPMGQNGQTDMFWNAPWNATYYSQQCLEQFNVTTRLLWPQIHWGGRRALTNQRNTSTIQADPNDPTTWGTASAGGASNIFFSQGQLDPWHGGGVTYNISFERDLITYFVQDAGHHMDLFFSNPADTDSVKFVRAQEKAAIKRWTQKQ